MMKILRIWTARHLFFVVYPHNDPYLVFLLQNWIQQFKINAKSKGLFRSTFHLHRRAPLLQILPFCVGLFLGGRGQANGTCPFIGLEIWSVGVHEKRPNSSLSPPSNFDWSWRGFVTLFLFFRKVTRWKLK
jgi:hypothetical protein